MKRIFSVLLVLQAPLSLGLVLSEPLFAQKTQPTGKGVALTADMVRGLELRNIGPAYKPGRVGDIAVDPRDPKVWYIATASSSLWKTTNAGTTWTSIFDEGPNSLGCLAIDPKNPDVIWVGTGENQSQRSVGFGDGVYKSTDGGKTWKNVGLKNSEHIGRFAIDPRNSDVVYVAAQGPAWAPGGDRGLYKTTDGGATWKAILTISENTGVTEILLDPRNPDVLYAASWQRRRNNGVLIGGGPEAAMFKSTDAGATWNKIMEGIPKVDLGRIALGISPQQPDVIYSLIYAAGKESGMFRSPDGGKTWMKQSGYRVTDPQYYGEIYPDPHTFDRIIFVDVGLQATQDGGKTIKGAGWPGMHSDHHAVWFNPKDSKHILVGNDGGLYESKDGGSKFRHMNNMPTTQYYRVAIDNKLPFYTVSGGTQDNGSHRGPSRTVKRMGITNKDWKSIGGGDGFQSRIDPEDPTIVYAMSQGMAISRNGKSIRPKGAGAGGAKGGGTAAIRGNWDCPYIISPHNPKRLYLGGNFLFRSDDRGDNWTPSPDLTRKLDRAKIPIMGKLWGKDAVTPHMFTTDLSIITAISESPKKENLVYVGTDDGLIQVSEDFKEWRKIDNFPGLPEWSYVSDVFASAHDDNVVYATFNNWQSGDFKPYVMKSSDRGKSWTSISSNLPARQPVWSIFEDHVNKDLLFIGTEFGLWFTVDGGKSWVQLKGGAPVIPFRDLEIQRRENDLVCATFGRGFFILDDYTPLRHLTPETLAKEGALFPIRKTYSYEEDTKSTAAPEIYVAKNPPYGAVITYYLKESLPKDAKIALSISNSAWGAKRLEITPPTTAGLHRVTWDLSNLQRVDVKQFEVTLTKIVGGTSTVLGEPQQVEIVALRQRRTKNDGPAAGANNASAGLHPPYFFASICQPPLAAAGPGAAPGFMWMTFGHFTLNWKLLSLSKSWHDWQKVSISNCRRFSCA